MSTPAGEESECDISSLLEMLATVPDPRKARGKMYTLSFLLAVSLVATLAGASNFRQIRDVVLDMPLSLLRSLGARWCYFRCRFGCPSERTIRRVLEQLDAAEVDRIIGAWLLARARRLADGVLVLAIDGKVLKGAWTDQNGQFTLFSAMIQQAAVTVGQVQVPAGTNEITQVEALLAPVLVPPQAQVVVTMDAAHTQHDTAEYLKGKRRFDYVMTVKGNQPKLLDAVFNTCLPRLRNSPDHTVEEHGRGLIKRWETWITDAAGIDFPHIEQVATIRRNTYTASGDWIGKEYAWIVTSGDATTISAANLHDYVRAGTGELRTRTTTHGMSSGVKTPNRSIPAAGPTSWQHSETSH